ncbi:monosaccharide ABC transporter membrane protein (CUT2 family) [Paenibacillus cellulosilyticus]|uniref:Autoinducer 2 import system permease protein LsrD n=1 Tax=Paenibacillus cellulosilyticus TaxID=375489 RepID=A0A2V2YZS7_9BACL|nr:ABC transporter permease [Paenibacillus cellulosilyticus]PWW07297.1 monosaccharide ABC transporter membrane protein (CUT2 family) [Paenibacillus cellulosilyticus]QKS44516.1 ABC transporter permease [Paenibacillus cellulosilyticus]
MEPRTIANEKPFSLKGYFLQWEWLLVVLLLAIFVMNANLSEYFLDYNNLRDATMGFLDKAFIVLPMVFIIMMGEIDISVASIVALTSVIMADLYSRGMPMEFAVVICLVVGAVCGWINGMLIVKFKELSSVIVTLSTMIIYRGIAYILLEDQAVGKFPSWFKFMGWGYVGTIPFILVAFVIFAAGFGFLLHKTAFGRRVYSIGNNATASHYSGVDVDRIKVWVFTLAGLMSAVTALFLTSRMGSTRPNIANGYELEVIAMVVLGGISTSGGKGRMIGAILAIFLIGFLRYGLGLVNVTAQTLLIILGLLLIFSVAIPQLKRRKGAARRL